MDTSTITRNFVVAAREADQRLDIYCTSRLPEISRSAIQRIIKRGEITVNGHAVKPRYIVREGDKVQIAALVTDISKQQADHPPDKEGEGGSIQVIYEDKDIVVINKPAGIAAHPGVGTRQTVRDWLVQRYLNTKNIGVHGREDIAHRLDKDTSGVMILAKTPSALRHLQEQFKRKRARKEYLALVFSVPGEQKGRITKALARSKRNPMRRTVDALGRSAITEWRKEEVFSGKYALLRVFPFTGRTHQIRAHLHYLGFPIVGDPLYTYKRQRPPKGVTRQMLHAERLTIELPNGKRKTFVAELPEDFTSVLASLRGGYPPDKGEAGGLY